MIANIILFVAGSGGNFLARILTLDPATIPIGGDGETASERSELYHYSNIDKLLNKKYNNFNIICSIIAFILSWNCNKESSIYLKLLYSLIAIILSYWYLLFYLVYYIYLNKNCSNEITFDITFNDIQNRLFPQNY